MNANLYIEDDMIGTVRFSIIDESMGAIGGEMIPNETYRKYQPMIQQHYEDNGISNMDNYNYRILLVSGTELLPEGGIGITDDADIDEIYVEATGLDMSMLPTDMK